MSDMWMTFETPLVSLGRPESWEQLPTGDDRVVVVAEPVERNPRFRANAVVLVRESTETIVELGARCIAQALAYPGFSHVYSDLEWKGEGRVGRTVNYFYEASGVCVAVAQYAFTTGTHAIEITGSCDMIDVLQYDELFTRIASATVLGVRA